MRSFGVAALVAAALATSAQPAWGQGFDRPGGGAREGGWFGIGVGLGSSSVSCRICAPDRRVGTAALLRGGLTLNPGVRLGAEIAGWARFSEVDQLLVTITPVAIFYPAPERGLFLEIGPSISLFSAKDQEAVEVGGTSFGVLLEAGYEVPLGGSAMLSPYLGFTATSFGTLTSDGREVVGGAGVTLIHLGVGVTFN